MIIQKTASKYQVGCKRGYGIEIPDLEFKLNLIIDKNRSEFPDARTDEEKEAGVLVDKEIHEGDTFLIDGTIFAVDHNRLVQVISETGPLAFQRIFDEVISPELEFLGFEDPDNEYAWEEIDKLPEDKPLEEYYPLYSWLRIWKERFVTEARNLRPVYTIKVTITDSVFGFSRDIYLQSQTIKYSPDEFDEDEIAWYVEKVFGWFYNEVDVI